MTLAHSIVVVGLLAAGGAALDNGLALTPPMGWRSWNLYGAHVTQHLMMQIMDGMVSKQRTVDGVPTSLCDVGYCDVGLDDNWQKCGWYGTSHYTYHTEDGYPVVNRQRFPDMMQMTDYAHTLGLTCGFYLNNCICRDHCGSGNEAHDAIEKCYRGDADTLNLLNFDGVKLDNCGLQKDLGLWARLFNESGKAVLVENCHWGMTVPYEGEENPPYNLYRTSQDVKATYASVIKNLNSVQEFADKNLSGPGTWAYPDMLEVGVRAGSGGSTTSGLDMAETRTHFAAWAIVSSPLILSHDVNNDTIMDQVWPIITNKFAIRVNQEYVGYSGGTFYVANETVELGDTTEGTFQSPICQYMYKPLRHGNIALLLINHAATDADLQLDLTTVPGINKTRTYNMRDVWSQELVGQVNIQTPITWMNVISHSSAFVILE